ncbi:MAG: hypothetical protein R6U15_08340 [Candidatus Izemoplasmatales bacterium]
MADRHTTVFGDQIDETALGIGLVKDAEDNLKVLVDDVTIEITGSTGSEGLQVKDLGISTDKLADDAVTNDKLADEAVKEANLDVDNAPTDGYVLSWNDTEGKFEWVSNEVDDVVKESDVICNEIPSGLINSLNVTFTIANTPVTGTVMVFLNGMLQAPGAGLDYTIAGTTITFVKAPRTNSDLYVSYIIDN